MEKSPIVISSWQNMITKRQSYVYDLKNNLRKQAIQTSTGRVLRGSLSWDGLL